MTQYERCLPNFFVVGAPKAGTTSLYHHLDQHPDVYMSPMKETWHFATDLHRDRLAPKFHEAAKQRADETRRYLDGNMMEKRFAGIVTEWADYRRLFARAEGQRAIGEATPCYLWSKAAAHGIARRFPYARILMILRNPADRAFSQYLQMFNSGDYNLSFREHIESAFALRDRRFISELHPFLECGLYADQVQRYNGLFPKEQIGIWLYEDTKSDSFLRTVFEFLGVDAGFAPDVTTRHLEQSVPRIAALRSLASRRGPGHTLRNLVPPSSRPMLKKLFFRPRASVTMTASERTLLCEFYQADVLKLERLIQRDLSAWLK